VRQVLPEEVLQVNILRKLWIRRRVQRRSLAQHVVPVAMHPDINHIGITGALINRHHLLHVAPMFAMSQTAIIQHAIVTKVNHFHRRPLHVLSIIATQRSVAHRPRVPDRPHILVPYHHHRRRCLKKNPEVETYNITLRYFYFCIYLISIFLYRDCSRWYLNLIITNYDWIDFYASLCIKVFNESAQIDNNWEFNDNFYEI